MTHGTRVTLSVGAQHFLVKALNGIEPISQPYEFTLTLLLPRSISLKPLLGSAANLSVQTDAGTRAWSGEIVDLVQEHEHGVSIVTVQVKFRSRLSRLREQYSEFAYTNCDSVSFLQQILAHHGIDRDQCDSRLVTHHFQFPYRMQVPGESDFDFFSRQLARSGIYFWSRTNTHLEEWVFADSTVHLRSYTLPAIQNLQHQFTANPPTVEFSDQIELSQGYSRITAKTGYAKPIHQRHGVGAPDRVILEWMTQCHWNAMKARSQLSRFDTSFPPLMLMDDTPYGKVIQLHHHADEDQYWQTVTVIPGDQPYHDPIPDHPPVPTAWLKKVDQHTQFRHLEPVGFHAPLLPGTPILLTAIDGNPDSPLISAVLLAENSRFSSEYFWNSVGGHEILLSDTKGILLQSSQGAQKIETNTKTLTIAVAEGVWKEHAKRSQWLSQSHLNVEVNHQFAITSNDYKLETNQGNLHWQTQQDSEWKTTMFSLHSDQHWQCQAKTLHWTHKTAKFQAKNHHVFASKRHSLQADSTLTLKSQGTITLRCKNHSIRLHPRGLIEMMGDQLNLQSDSLLNWQGVVNYFDRLRWESGSLQRLQKRPLLWHEPWTSSTQTTIRDCHWENSWEEWDHPIQANFTWHRASSNAPVKFSVYACQVPLHHTVSGSKTAPMDSPEQRKLLFSETVIPTALQGSEHFQITWQHRPEDFDRWSGHVVFRFHIQAGDENARELSTPLQLLGTLTLSCQEPVRAGAIIKVAIPEGMIQGGRGEPPLTACELSLNDQQCQLTRIPFYTALDIRLQEPGLPEILALNAAQLSPRLREIFTDDQKQPSTCLTTWLLPKHDHHLNLGVLMPSMWINARPDAEPSRDPNARWTLTPEELQYFQTNGSQITIFVHGFNVDVLAAQDWHQCMEMNLNHAAGFTEDYHDYKRILTFFWKGDPAFAPNFYSAIERSHEDAKQLARLIIDLQQRAPELTITIIAHSLGCQVVLSALELVKKTVNQILFWQAALSRQALTAHPKILNAAYSWKVLYSQNDSLLGPLRGEKLFSLTQSRINQYKPFSELLLGCFCKYFDLNNLYSIALTLGMPVSAFLDREILERTYLKWREQHPAQLSHTQFLVKSDLKLYFGLIRIYAVLMKLGLVNAGKLREHGFAILALGATNVLHPVVLTLILIGELFHQDFRAVMKHFESIKGTQSFIQLSDWCNRAFDLFQLVMESHPTETAMGYAGIAHGDPSGRIQELDLTEWIYSHSDMKNPRSEVQTQVYRDRLLPMITRDNTSHRF